MSEGPRKVRYPNENKLPMPRRIRGGSGVRRREPTKAAVSFMLRNPTYAGAYGKTRFGGDTGVSR